MDGLTDTALSASASAAYGRAQAASAQLGRGGADRTQIRQAAQKFEAVFLSQMFSHMFEGVKSDGLFGGGQGEEMFRSLLVDEYAKEAARKGGVGIADAVMRTLIAQQEKS